ncbi:MarR family transcriptional regulator [Amycolatopsis methanolica]|uniref:MarR family transcriptional regulator n=1 Tax=Amycolatopsis methanolica TaxID=1814 RepID=UPI003439F2DB
MSSKTDNRTTQDTTTQPNTPAGRTDAEDKLWAALHANPHSTAADLAVAAKIGKSTAGKILVRWAADGSVTRTPGIGEGGRRVPDTWAITDAPVTADTPTTGSAPTEPDVQGREAGDEASVAISPRAEGSPTAPVSPEAPTTTGAAQPETGTGGAGDGDGSKQAERLAPGALRGMVEDYLRDHPGDEFGPTAIAKALGGKSSGAVSNALDKLVADGTAVRTKDKPRRFALAPAEQGHVSKK